MNARGRPDPDPDRMTPVSGSRPAPHMAPGVGPGPPTDHLTGAHTMSVKSLLMTAGIALVVVLAYDKAKGNVPALKIGV